MQRRIKNKYYHKKTEVMKVQFSLLKAKAPILQQPIKSHSLYKLPIPATQLPSARIAKRKAMLLTIADTLAKPFANSAKDLVIPPLIAGVIITTTNNSNNNKYKCDYNDSNRFKNNENRASKKGKYKQSNAAEENKKSAMCIKHIAPETPTKNIKMTISPLINEEEAYKLYQPYNVDDNVNNYKN